ncbi:hypothetical protein V6N12_039319 [Hibiscus sabdariffa]|uniref:RNase H type-1 domain-containing protein n=1 Tax=Hibiscus sabdariffa TaxID=183260 RepID=A0ABR2E0C8_9ROSI
MRCSICWNFGSTLGRVTWVYWKDTRWIILHTWNSLLPYAPWLVKNVCGDGMSYRILCRSCTVAYSSYKATIGCKTLSRTPKGQGLSIAALLCSGVEDPSHLFRFCIEEKLDEFLQLDLQQWILMNIHKPSYFPKEYCCDVFVSQEKPRVHCPLDVLHVNRVPEQPPGIHVWQQPSPPAQEIKVNTDGTTNSISDLATCGGVGRDANSKWWFEFAKVIGACSVLETELWDISYM